MSQLTLTEIVWENVVSVFDTGVFIPPAANNSIYLKEEYMAEVRSVLSDSNLNGKILTVPKVYDELNYSLQKGNNKSPVDLVKNIVIDPHKDISYGRYINIFKNIKPYAREEGIIDIDKGNKVTDVEIAALSLYYANYGENDPCAVLTSDWPLASFIFAMFSKVNPEFSKNPGDRLNIFYLDQKMARFDNLLGLSTESRVNAI